MPNYKIEGNIDFYSSLYSSLDYDSDTQDSSEICEISGSKLTTNFVTLECTHKFNYHALYTEICQQKFELQTYTLDVLSKNDVQKFRDSKLDYYIKCPYCRNIQFTLLPYHEELPFKKKYGVNTNDPDFKVIKTFSSYPRQMPPNYNFLFYGYTFTKGECCKTNVINGKEMQCYNCYTTSIIAPDGTTKELCQDHVRAEVKAFKLLAKKEAIEKKLQAKHKALEEKEAKKLAAKEAKSETKQLVKKTETSTGLLCLALLKSGPRKGESCNVKSFENNLCKRHQPNK